MYELLAKKRPVNGCGTPFEMICFFKDYDYRFTAMDLVDREIYQEALIIDEDYRCIMYVEFDKELEKYGFQKGYNLFCTDDTPKIIVAIVDEERSLKIQYSDSAWWDNNYWYLYSYSQDVIYDLIKADLVEKVGESDES